MDANEIRPAISANRVPTPTLERLATYLKCLHDVAQAGVTTISSAALQEMAGINASQFRKDLSYFGEFGRPGVGYHVADLHDRITAILHMDVDQRMVLVGAGNLGAALAGYPGLTEERLHLVAAFDNDPAKIGRKLWHLEVRPIESMGEVNAALGARIGIIAVPRSAAQAVAGTMIAAGILAILNFAPIILRVPPAVLVRNVSVTQELSVLCYHLEAAPTDDPPPHGGA
ncbi:MAG: redox-sensing transcriptional repressor Rex [Armatimonadetes bacterium]|nr:redox-sensing transcriptional repressor Rex [Armatimonadota bacterium]